MPENYYTIHNIDYVRKRLYYVLIQLMHAARGVCALESSSGLILLISCIQVQTPLTQLRPNLKLKWRRGKDTPFGVHDHPQAVVVKGKVYIGGGRAYTDIQQQTVMVYDPQLDSFDRLPPYTYKFFSMAVVNNQLVVVGGADVLTGMAMTKKLGVWNELSKTWTHPLIPPMTIACCSPSVVVYGKWLIVIGGYGDRFPLSRVEILDTTEPRQWHIAAPLPWPCYWASTATTGNMCYLMGGYSRLGHGSAVYSVCLDDLIRATTQPVTTNTPSPWTPMPDTPLGGSTACCLNGALMTVGGVELFQLFQSSKTIYHYQPSTRRWIKAGELPAGQERCACTVLPSGELFVTGGGGLIGCNTSVVIASIDY